MRVLLLSDTHFGRDMQRFGDIWADHQTKVLERWRETVHDGDIVCVPGDLTWARSMETAMADLALLDALPGRKVIIRGNHDWWWRSVHQVRSALPPTFTAIDGDAVAMSGVIFAGCKGYLSPNDAYYREKDFSSFDRNIARAKAAFDSALDLQREATNARGAPPIVFMLHYPPCTSAGDPTPFSEMLEGDTNKPAPVAHCVFGHFHFKTEWEVVFKGTQRDGGVQYHLGSADYLDFTPKQIL